MKKLALTIAIILGMSMTTFAAYEGGLFKRGTQPEGTTGIYNRTTINGPMLPIHDQDTNQTAPLGSGIAVLLGLGGAYLVAKKHREE